MTFKYLKERERSNIKEINDGFAEREAIFRQNVWGLCDIEWLCVIASQRERERERHVLTVFQQHTNREQLKGTKGKIGSRKKEDKEKTT